MTTPVRETIAMIAGMQPELRPGLFTFSSLPPGAPLPSGTIASFAEDEGLSVVVPVDGESSTPMRCITLRVQSALDGVGLTAAVAATLAELDIPANVIAAFHHDHVFVPAAMAGRALAALEDLQRKARA